MSLRLTRMAATDCADEVPPTPYEVGCQSRVAGARRFVTLWIILVIFAGRPSICGRTCDSHSRNIYRTSRRAHFIRAWPADFAEFFDPLVSLRGRRCA